VSLADALGWPLGFELDPQDLSSDRLLRDAPRLEAAGRPWPALGGIPLLAKIGQGGMGSVYYAIHPRLRREVAIKVLAFHPADRQPELVSRFFREAQVAAQVQSPHLVAVLDVNEEHGLHYLVMEFVAGLSAASYLRLRRDAGKTGLDASEALQIGIAASEGLAAAHAKGVIHRDVKPDNILIPWAERGRRLDLAAAKLADLGLAREEAADRSLTATQATMGTPGFMAPEQAHDARRAGPAADVFGLGASLYALLSGSAPFTGSSAFATLMATAHEPHKPISQIRPDVSPLLAAVLDRCLEKQPEARFAGGAALRDALKACRDRTAAAFSADATAVVRPPASAQEGPSAPVRTPVAVAPATPTPALMQPPGATPAPSPLPSRASGPALAPAPATAPTIVARSGWRWVWAAAVLLLALGGTAGGGWYYLLSNFAGHVKQARTATDAGDWPAALASYQEALAVPGFAGNREAREGLDKAQRAVAFASARDEARLKAQARDWPAAEAAWRRASAVPGWGDDAEAREGLAQAVNAQAFARLLAQAQVFLEAENWSQAESACRQALGLPGCSQDPLAQQGLARAVNGQSFGTALAEAQKALERGDWAALEQAARRALAVPGYAQSPAAEALIQKAKNGQSFADSLAEAQRALTAEDWRRAETAFSQAATLAQQPHSPVAKDALQTALNGQSFGRLAAETSQLLKEFKWVAAETTARQALAVSGYTQHAGAARLRQAALSGQVFERLLVQAREKLARQDWAEALQAFKEALNVPGFEANKEALDGLKAAQLGLAFTGAMEEGNKSLQAGRFGEAQSAFQRALQVEGCQTNAEARAGLAQAEAGLERQKKAEAYRAALAKARELRAAVPPGERQADAWGALKEACRAALACGHPNTQEAEALLAEAEKKEAAARLWLESDQLAAQARQCVERQQWDAAEAALKRAQALAPRADVGELLTEIARGQGRPYWRGDVQYLDYKGHRLVLAARGDEAARFPILGFLRRDPARDAVMFWVRLAEKDIWTVYDETLSSYVNFTLNRNEHVTNAQKTEKTEWVGLCTQEGGRWCTKWKLVRQFDKNLGGSGSLYLGSVTGHLTFLENNTAREDLPFTPTLWFNRAAREVPEEVAKKLVDAYLVKWSGAEKE
jgi:hypothetical protein